MNLLLINIFIGKSLNPILAAYIYLYITVIENYQ
jgi:hypothetical protein